MKHVVTQFKDIAAFENLKMELSNEIAGNFAARLKEAGMSDAELNELTDNVCYDIASAISTIGDLDIPSTDNISAVMEEKTDDISNMLQEKTDDISAMLQEKTNEIDGFNEVSKEQVQHHVEGVLTQDKILQILNAAKPAPT